MSSLVEQQAGSRLAEPEDTRQESAGAGGPVAELAAGPGAAREAAEESASAGKTAPAPALAHPLVQDLMLEPTRWRIWSAIAVLRWLQRKSGRPGRRLVYRSEPSLSFPGSEIHDVAIREGHLELTLNALGLASAGSPLPSADIERIIADKRNGGALSAWLDWPTDRFMQVLERMQAHCNAPFALMTGGQVDAHSLLAAIVGRSAPLTAGPGGALHNTWQWHPEGAIGLAGLFLGPVSAAGLQAVFQAFTGLPVQVREFTGAELLTARPARVGLRMGMILGATCRLPSAGVEVHIDGGSDPDSRRWAGEPVRRRSLHFLALSYVGAPSPAVRILLRLEPDNATPATLADGCALGGLAVLGTPELAVQLPLEA